MATPTILPVPIVDANAVVNAENEMKHKKLDLEGIKCQTKEIAKKLNIEQSTISKKISQILKLS